MKTHKQNEMIRMLKRSVRARREHGLALLFTLCILSMALITAMIFSSNSSTDRKVASAYVDTSAARILADGVVNRAILSLLQSDNAAYVCSNYKTSPPRNSDANEYASDWIWKLEKDGIFSFDAGPLRFNSSVYYDPNDARCPSWEYVFGPVYGDPDNEHILGRYAYVAIGQNDQLNPNALGRRDYPDFDLTRFQKRLGRWTCEPEFIFKSTRNNWDYTANSPQRGAPVISRETIRSKYSSPGWEDIDVFFTDIVGDSGEENQQLKMMIDQYFDATVQGEYNRYRLDGKASGDLTKYNDVPSEEHYRFPLIRTDWDSIRHQTVKDAIPWFQNSSEGNVDQVVANLINFNASASRPPVDDGQSWFTGEPKFTGNKRTPYINEVLAEVSVSGYLGMRKMERYLKPEGDSQVPKWRLWYQGCTYSPEITISVETVNMYPSSGENAAISVRNPILIGEVSFDYWNDNGDMPGFWATETLRFDANNQPWTDDVRPIPGDDAGYMKYIYFLDGDALGNMTTRKRDDYDMPIGHEADFMPYVRVKNVRVKVDRVVLLDNSGRNADLSLMPMPLSGSGIVFEQSGDPSENAGIGVAGADDDLKKYCVDTQANDPRQNLSRNDWSTPLYGTTAKSDIGKKNGVGIKVGTYHDTEQNNNNPNPAYVNDSTHISTAYIRHAPMQSLWELGAIHRGAPWQTINLKCGSKNGVAMGSYETGDGHLLDQVALARSTEKADDAVVGMINLNCVATFGGGKAPFSFKSLFTNFPVYQTFENMNKSGSSGAVYTIRGDSVDSDKTGTTDADLYAKELSEAVTYALSNGYYLRRTAVFPTMEHAQMEHIIPLGNNVPDAQSEEIFARVVNLLKWNRQPVKRATVLVLAQTIQDVGGDVPLEKTEPSNSNVRLRDAGFMAFSSTSKRVLGPNSGNSPPTIKFARTSPSDRVKFRYYEPLFDQITGEAKLIVRLEWDDSAYDNHGAWKVTRKEYAE